MGRFVHVESNLPTPSARQAPTHARKTDERKIPVLIVIRYGVNGRPWLEAITPPEHKGQAEIRFAEGLVMDNFSSDEAIKGVEEYISLTLPARWKKIHQYGVPIGTWTLYAMTPKERFASLVWADFIEEVRAGRQGGCLDVQNDL